MQQDFTYVGCFVEPDMLHKKLAAIPRAPLSRPVRVPHVTVAYRPEDVDRTLFGTVVRIRIIGYGRDGHNEGVRVELFTEEPRLAEQFQGIGVPHITLSVSQDGEAVNTKNLRFTPVEPIELPGTYGGYTREGVVCTLPPHSRFA